MKYFILMIATFFLVILSSPSFSSYVIKLKTGEKFVTKSCWEEDGEIKFYRYGGIIGVKKGLVDRIQEVPSEPEEVTEEKVKQGSEEKRPASSPEEAPKKEAPEAKPPAPQAPEKPAAAKGDTAKKDPDLATYQRAYLDLKGRHEQANKIYWKARRAKDIEAEKKALDEVQSLKRRLKDLEAQVKEKNNGVLPEWWK